MGYEINLLIGRSTALTSNEYKQGEPEIDGNEIYRPLLKGEHGECIKTGRKETWFDVMATIDLCRCGDSNIIKIDHENKDENHHWYWYTGDVHTIEDCCGIKLKPVPMLTVIQALKKDVKNGDYRRFKWGLALLESMKSDPEKLSVLLYGH